MEGVEKNSIAERSLLYFILIIEGFYKGTHIQNTSSEKMLDEMGEIVVNDKQCEMITAHFRDLIYTKVARKSNLAKAPASKPKKKSKPQTRFGQVDLYEWLKCQKEKTESWR
jgi:hypothetical protein